MRIEDSSDELDRIAAESNYNYRTNTNPKDIYDEDKITFKNSIRNKYKKKKSEQIMDDIKKQEEKLKNSKPNHNVYESKYNNKENNNINKKPSRKSKEFKSKNNIDDTNPSSYKKYARKLSKMNISSTNWNINQLGDINTYPDAMEVEE